MQKGDGPAGLTESALEIPESLSGTLLLSVRVQARLAKSPHCAFQRQHQHRVPS